MLNRFNCFLVAVALACDVACAQDWQTYNAIPGRVQEVDSRSVRSEEGRVFFTYRERWLNYNVGGLAERPIRAVGDCAARKRADLEFGGTYVLRDVYPGTGQADQLDLACRLAGQSRPELVGVPTSVSPIPNSVIRLAEPSPSNRLGGANAAPTPSPPLKVAFVYVGPVGDGGWTYAHDAGRRAMQAQLAERVQVTWVEKVPEGVGATSVLQRLIDEGHSLIFTTAFGYQEPVAQAAMQNPRVRFEQANGYKTAHNVRTYDVRGDEGVYLAGVLAGRMTRTNVLGFVASIPIPELVRNINAFTLGARSVNPRARVRVSWVGKWFNPPKEALAARALIEAGADILLQNTDSSEVLVTAQRMGKRAIGWDSDMSVYAPKAHLASVVMNWGPYYVKAVRDALDDTWSSGRYKWGVREDSVQLQSVANDVPTEVRQELTQLTASIASGSRQIWRGPIANNRGRIMLEANSVLGDERLETMYFLVEGVDATLPPIK